MEVRLETIRGIQIFLRLVLVWSTVILKAVIIRRIMFKANIVSRIRILTLGCRKVSN